MNHFLNSIFNTQSVLTMTFSKFVLSMVAAMVIGLIIAYVYTYKSSTSKSFLITLAVLPMVVAMVIIMVNGNLGAGVAVAGAFSLVRFRSIPGSAKEILVIFMAMCVGITIGMGYILFALLFGLMACGFYLILSHTRFGEQKAAKRQLNITVPENLNYTDAFEESFKKYVTSFELMSIKTISMGSLFKLSYEIELIDEKAEKEFIDALRCTNGNLEIMLIRQSLSSNNL